MQHDPKTGPPDPELAHELFGLVETDQGRAFISDGCEVLSRQELFNLAQGALKYSRRVVRTLEKFMKREHPQGADEHGAEKVEVDGGCKSGSTAGKGSEKR